MIAVAIAIAAGLGVALALVLVLRGCQDTPSHPEWDDRAPTSRGHFTT
jgi:hypothetical protein